MRKFLRNLTTLWWRATKPKARYEIAVLQRQLKEAQRKHKATRHIYLKIRAVTEMNLRGQNMRLQ